MAFALSTMQLDSSAFAVGGSIPTRYTGKGKDVSPALSWQGAPEDTKGFALICHDPDAPLVQNGTYGFVHWVLYNLPASTTSLEENSGEGTPTINDIGKLGYGALTPPEGLAFTTITLGCWLCTRLPTCWKASRCPNCSSRSSST